MPRFSIIIPCFNAAQTLPETLASLRAQHYTDYEVLCVDDGSTDDTMQIILAETQVDPRVRALANCSKGPASARNTGAQHARGEIIAFLDADDLWAPEKLSRLSRAFQELTLDACYARVAFFDRDKDQARVFSTVPKRALGIADLLGENPVCTMSNVAVRRDLFLHSGGFDPAIVHNEDLEWLIRFVGRGANMVGLNQTLVWYRANPKGLSADLAAMRRGRRAALATALGLGHQPTTRHEAIHLRYLARRALRLQAPGLTALRLTLAGVRVSPSGFFSNPRRGVLTAVGSLVTPLLPRRLSGALFAR